MSLSAPPGDTQFQAKICDETLNEDPEREEEQEDLQLNESQVKKKKKKKAKKSASVKAKEATAKAKEEKEKPPVLCISRNKHWKYISSYHGPWLQLPLELLESLLSLNLDPTTFTPSPEQQVPAITNLPYSANNIPNKSRTNANLNNRERDKGFHNLSSLSNPPAGPGTFTNPKGHGLSASSSSLFSTSSGLPSPPPLPNFQAGKAPPPPIDPSVFRNVASIRRLIDEAAELSVRASSGLSAAELRATGGLGGGSSGGIFSSLGGGGSAWNAAQTLGINPLGNHGAGGGRNVAMSAMRIHRLRALAVQKLAAAYKADEIASSVMVMQGGSVFDDVAEKVLKVDPNDIDAKYVNFFHEKIPSRQLAESTTTQTLDQLIQAQPQRLEFYRTRGIVHSFKDEYPQATKDFTYALKEARAARKAKMNHVHGDTVNGGGGNANRENGESRSSAKGKKKKQQQRGGKKMQASVADEDSSETASTAGSSPTPDLPRQAAHHSALPYPESPDPLEPQLLFLRGAAYLSHAIHLIENAVLNLEGVVKAPTLDGAELRLCYLEDGKYGGVEIGHPDGPLGARGGEKVMKYREIFMGAGEGKKDKGAGAFRGKVEGLLRKSIRDHERFLGHFDSLESGPPPISVENLRAERREYHNEDDEDASLEECFGWVKEGRHVDLLNQTEYAFYLSESIRPGNHQPTSPPPSTTTMFNSSYLAEHENLHAPPPTFTTYHPLLVESHFSILICLLLLGDFAAILERFARTSALVDGLEGYPVFLPPRSMAQAEFIEVLERLAGGWKIGCKGSFAELEREREKQRETESVREGKGKMIAAPPVSRIEEVKETDAMFVAPAMNGESSSSASSSVPSVATTPRSTTPDETSSVHTPPATSNAFVQTQNSNAWVQARPDAVEALECARILLAPVITRQREKAEKVKAEKATRAREKSAAKTGQTANGKDLVVANGSSSTPPQPKKPVPINIPLHGPRVEVVLAWMGAIHLPELEGGDLE